MTTDYLDVAESWLDAHFGKNGSVERGHDVADLANLLRHHADERVRGAPGPLQTKCMVCGKMVWAGWFAVGPAGAPPSPVTCGACCNPPRDEAPCPYGEVLSVGTRVRDRLYGEGTIVAASAYHVKFDGKATLNTSSGCLEVIDSTSPAKGTGK